jgi:hypothetical protein
MDNKQSAYLKNKTTVSTFSTHSFRKPEASQTAIEKGKLYAKMESHKSRVLKKLYNKKIHSIAKHFIDLVNKKLRVS